MLLPMNNTFVESADQEVFSEIQHKKTVNIREKEKWTFILLKIEPTLQTQ
jgi:hypothetical protein